MKSTLIAFLCYITCLHAFGQEKPKSIPLFVGYYGPYFIQPGGKVGTLLSVRDWDKSTDEKQRLHQLYVSPQLSVFTRTNNHLSVAINADVGYRFITKKDLYLAPSIGLGYLISSHRMSASVNLGSGAISEYEREIRHQFLPTGNLEIGHEAITRKMGWYLKLLYGGMLFGPTENSGLFAAELGMRFRILIRNQKSTEP